MRSIAQAERQATRKKGRYSQAPICEICGKSAGFDYRSSPNDIVHVCCDRKKCLAEANRRDPSF